MYRHTLYKDQNFDFFIFTEGKLTIEQKSSMENFRSSFASLCDSFREIIPFAITTRNSIISKRMIQLGKLYSQNETRQFQAEYMALSRLISDLGLLKEGHSQGFRKMKSKLRKQSSNVSWNGFRFEARVLSLFVQKGIEVIVREAPDFEFPINGVKVFAEATYPTVGSKTKENYDYKITSAIRSKNKKAYANKDTSLFIDMTNIVHHSLEANALGNPIKAISDLVAKEEIKFGSILLCTSAFSEKNGETRMNKVYNRVDLEGCSDNLKIFLDYSHPMGHVAIEDIVVPKFS